MRYGAIGKDFHTRNRERLCSMIGDSALAIIYGNDEVPRNGDQYYPFRQNSDLFYLTGIEQEKTVLLLCPGASDVSQRIVLFLLEPNDRMETWQGHKLTPAEATEISGISSIKYLSWLDPELVHLEKKYPTLYFNAGNNASVNLGATSHSGKIRQALEARFPKHKLESVSGFLEDLRLTKEPEEISCIRRACEITRLAFEKITREVKPGMMEYEVEAEIAYEFTRNGACFAYNPIVASGRNACTLHYARNDSPLGDEDLLLIDFGAEYANYAADCTRTIPVSGHFTERQRLLYDATLRVFKKTIPLMIPGNTIAGINEKVCCMWEAEHIALRLYDAKNLVGQDKAHPLCIRYSIHGVSHFIGLDVHDAGSKLTVLKPGMVLTCEPGIYLPNEHTGIRIETNILVTGQGPIDLMQHIPVGALEIEQMMSNRNR